MEQDDKYIKELFSSAFAEDEMSGSDEEWMVIEKKLNLIRFFRFSWLSFNIYYASAIILSFLVSTAVGTHYLLNLNSPESPQTPVIHILEKISVEKVDTVPVISEKINQPVNTEVYERKVAKAIKQAPKVAKISEEEQLSFDSSKIKTEVMKIETSKMEEEEEVRKVVIIKQDTIINYDSVTVKPKFLFFGK